MAFVFVDNQIPEIEEELIALGFVPEAYPGVLEDVGGQAYFATKPLGSPVTDTKPDTGTVSSKGWAFYRFEVSNSTARGVAGCYGAFFRKNLHACRTGPA